MAVFAGRAAISDTASQPDGASVAAVAAGTPSVATN
jgi:hypothetical protein